MRARLLLLLAFTGCSGFSGPPPPFIADVEGAWVGQLTYGYVVGAGPAGPVADWDAELDLMMLNGFAFSGTILLSDAFGSTLGPLDVTGALDPPDAQGSRLGRMTIAICEPAGMTFNVLVSVNGIDADLASPTWPCNDAGEGLPAFGSLTLQPAPPPP